VNKLKDVELISTGVYLPGEPVAFDNIEDVIGRLDKAPLRIKRMRDKLYNRVKSLTAVEQCYFAIDHATKEITESNATMAAKAIKEALKRADMKPQEIDCILLATALPDYRTPPTTPFVQEELGIERCSEMEIHSNCTGVTKVFQIALDALRVGRYKNVVVAYSLLCSPYFISDYYNQEKVKPEDILLRWILSDSASAVVLRAKDNLETGIKVIDVYNMSLGGKLAPGMWAYFGCANYNLRSAFDNGVHHLAQDYGAVNKTSPRVIATGLKEIIKQSKIKTEDIDYILSTSPSVKIMEETKELVVKELSLSPDVSRNQVNNKGYSGGSSVIIGIDEMLDEKRFKPGDLLIAVVIESSKWMVGGIVLEYVN
jgi:3-oxoacyl-[acyl-carrier-protein] synthase-3